MAVAAIRGVLKSDIPAPAVTSSRRKIMWLHY
jgi:hypothetical protein